MKAHRLLQTTDARVWAKKFTKKFKLYTDNGVVYDPYGVMLAWFANAIETGRDRG